MILGLVFMIAARVSRSGECRNAAYCRGRTCRVSRFVLRALLSMMAVRRRIHEHSEASNRIMYQC